MIDKIKKFSIVIFLLIIYTYISNICFMQNKYIILSNQNLKIPTVFGIKLEKNNNILEVSSNKVNDSNNIEVLSYDLKLFNKIKLKKVQVNIVDNMKVIPLGNVIGIKMYVNGALVVGKTEIRGIDGDIYKPYESSNIKEGDLIIELDGNKIKNTLNLVEIINKIGEKEVNIKYISDNKEIIEKIKPIKVTKDQYKIGLWVRDSAGGVGTITFCDEKKEKFAALGHGVSDIDTLKLLDISEGELVTTNIISIIKGQKGKPGEIKGNLDNIITLGKISKNTGYGIFGSILDKSFIDNSIKPIEVANRNEIKEGEAKIYCQLDEKKVMKYNIEIKRIYNNNNENNKSFLIEINDEDLMNKTNGIIQGMSRLSNNSK